MESSEKKRMEEQLYTVLASINDPAQVAAFLEDLCTRGEIEQMAQRIECAKLLLEGNTYNRIIAETEVSSATLSRVSRCTQHGSGGYSRVLAKFLGIENYL